jgi:hypothetical protein
MAASSVPSTEQHYEEDRGFKNKFLIIFYEDVVDDEAHPAFWFGMITSTVVDGLLASDSECEDNSGIIPNNVLLHLLNLTAKQVSGLN